MIEIIIFLQVVIVVGGPFFLTHINKRVGSYATEVGKITALNKKIDEVIEQQKQITKATEETKAEIAHLAWNKKESQIIKRKKLEEYLKVVFEVMEIMRNCAAKTYGTEKIEIDPLPVTTIAKLTTIQMLYLPELEESNNKLADIISEYEEIFNVYAIGKMDIVEFDKNMKEKFALLGSTTKEITVKSKEVVNSLFEIK